MNASTFEVQRSTDARTFETAGFVSAGGTLKNGASYAYLDQRAGAYSVSGLVYYRLKMVDNDGTFAYSRMESVSFKDAGQIIIEVVLYPNPVGTRRKLNLVSKEWINDDVLALEILDHTGKVIIKKSVLVKQGKEPSVDIKHLSSGIYFIRITGKSNVTVKKFVVE